MEKRATVDFVEMERLANNVAKHLNDKEELQDDLKRADELYAKYDPYDEEEGYMFEALEIIVAMIKDIIN